MVSGMCCGSGSVIITSIISLYLGGELVVCVLFVLFVLLITGIILTNSGHSKLYSLLFPFSGG